LEVGVLEKPITCTFYPVLYPIFVPPVGDILGALGKAKELETLFLAIRQLLLTYGLLEPKGLLCND
jgi:hypothetical protein